MEKSVESGLVVINCPTKEGVVTFVINLLIALNSGIAFSHSIQRVKILRSTCNTNYKKIHKTNTQFITVAFGIIHHQVKFNAHFVSIMHGSEMIKTRICGPASKYDRAFPDNSYQLNDITIS